MLLVTTNLPLLLQGSTCQAVDLTAAPTISTSTPFLLTVAAPFLLLLLLPAKPAVAALTTSGATTTDSGQ